MGFILAMNLSARGDALDAWTNVAVSPYGNFNSITYGNGVFVAGSSIPYHGVFSGTNGGISASSDGVHWAHTGFGPAITGVAYGNGMFVATGSDPNTSGSAGAIYFSANGSTWSTVSGLPGLNAVTFGKGVFVAVGFKNEGQAAYITVSTDGRNWNSQGTGSGYVLTGAGYGNGQFIATGYINGGVYGEVLVSPDGTNWTDANAVVPGPPMIPPLPPGLLSTNVGKVRFVNNLYYAGSYSSPDGTNWTVVSPPAPMLWVSQSGTNHLYIGVGAAGGVYTSMDATNWVTRGTGVTNDLNWIAYGNGRMAVVGSGGGVFLSGSTVPILTAQNQLPGGMQLTISGGLGPTYQLQASADLKAWTNLITFTNIGAGTNYLDAAAGSFGQRFYRTVSP